MNEKKAICGICPAGCWVVVTYDFDGKINLVRADDSSPYGMICKLGVKSRDIVYSRDRLKYPMKRKGPKGTFDFERISWDQAFEIIVHNLNNLKETYGPEVCGMYTGRGSFELALCDFFQPKGVAVSSASSVLFPFGSPNTFGVGALCYVSFAMIAPHVTMGGMLINMYSDIENSELIVVWGANPATDCPPSDLKRILRAKNRGAEVYVIDPRQTLTAKITKAKWLGIRPGTDGALALGLCHVLVKENLYDKPFVENWTLGFDDFSHYVKSFDPEKVAGITGIPAREIIILARKIAKAKGASPVMYTGLEYSNSGVQAIRATFVLWALAGQLDVPGGRMFSMKGNNFPINRDGNVPNPDPASAIGRDHFPLYTAYREESHAISLPRSVLQGIPYKIRSLFILGGSIITSWPQSDIWKSTLNGLDFLVSMDRQLTADCAYADIVLPATTMYEITSYLTYGAMFRIREKVIEPVAEARNDFLVLAELAKRLGYPHLYPQSEEEIINQALKKTEFTLEKVRKEGGIVRIPSVDNQYKKWQRGLLREDGKVGFETPSGKFEIASTIFKKFGYEPLPVYTEPLEGPISKKELTRDFPLIFNSGSRVNTDFRSQHHGIKSLYIERPQPTVTINTDDAGVRSINDGDIVLVRSPRGEVRMRAFVTSDIIKGSIDANMGGGGPVGPRAWQNGNVNDLTDLENYDPISGFPVFKSLLCQVEKISDNQDDLKVNSGEFYSLFEKWQKDSKKKSAREILLDSSGKLSTCR